ALPPYRGLAASSIYSQSPVLSSRMRSGPLDARIFFRVEIEQRAEQREDHRAEHDAHRAEQHDAAENAEKKKQHRQPEAVADQERLENIVHRADKPQTPDEQHHAAHGRALKEQIDR